MANIDEQIKNIAVKLRKIRELKSLTREQFCEPLGENVEYWGLIERGEQPISLVKLMQVCETYNIPIDSLIDLDYQNVDETLLKEDIHELLELCKGRQLEIIKRFISEIVMTL